MSNWYFFYQPKGGEDDWQMALSTERDRVINTVRPAFTTVLDISAVPEDHDWSKVRYQGPLYFDFDAGDDLPFVCEKFKDFLAKVLTELDFDVNQARLYASGGKGFHVEIPEACFMPKIAASGTAWLPYVYREMAQAVMVDTLDLSVYTGKRGRMWRTAGVKRDNGNYKVPITVEEAFAMSEDLYREVIKEARPEITPTPPICNSRMAMLFERSKSKLVDLMRTKKKRQAVASTLLDPWKKAKKTPPSIERLMNGEDIAEGSGFQQLSMQLSIYAVSVNLELQAFLDMSKGLCENHVSDSHRYNTPAKRREELARMFRYMEDNTLYEFDPGPIAKLTKPGVSIADLGVLEDSGEPGSPDSAAVQESDEDGNPVVDVHRGIRRGVVMNRDGIFKRTEDGGYESLSRGHMSKVVGFLSAETKDFKGYEFDLATRGRNLGRKMIAASTLTSASKLRDYLGNHQISYLGSEAETAGLLDIMSERAESNGIVYVYPREGLFVINNPEIKEPTPTKVYLTKDTFLSSLKEDDEHYFKLSYRADPVESSYCIDIHKAPSLDEKHKEAIHALLSMTRADVLGDLLGWMVAAHYRSFYLHLFDQFPMLQIWGEAGAGKTQTVLLLCKLHWYTREISIRSAAACTTYALQAAASNSTSAPLVIDEYKPRELRMMKGKYEGLKDLMKANYVAGDVGERGTVNKGAENNMSVVRSKATSPIVFMGETIEMETAIFERCVSVNLSKSYQTRPRRAAFARLKADPEALSALGRQIVEMGFAINLPAMRDEVNAIRATVEARLPDDESRKEGERLIYNRTVVIHGLQILKRVLSRTFGTEFDEVMDQLMVGKSEGPQGDDLKVVQMHGMSEISKVVSRIALLSREVDKDYEMRHNRDYLLGDDWVEILVERSFDQYRRFCRDIGESVLFDNLDAFSQAFNAYSPCIDRVCADSPLRPDDSTQRVVRLSLKALRREGVQTFRTV